MRREARALALAAIAAVCAVVAGVAFGSVDLPLLRVFDALAGAGDAIARTIVWELRLPRAVAAFAIGGLLAVAGVYMQTLLQNPLADPYVLGISGGAAVVTLALALLGIASGWWPLGAFVGAVGAAGLVFALSRGEGAWTPARLALTGIVLAAGWGALIGILLALSPERDLRGLLFWLMGDLGAAGSPHWALAALAVGAAAGIAFGRDLDMLARGPLLARALGVETRLLQIGTLLLASLLTAVAVSMAGPVGFVGLVVPHLMRLSGARQHRWLVPAAALGGGALLAGADALARGWAGAAGLPVGAVTALIGVPLFLLLLRRGTVTGH